MRRNRSLPWKALFCFLVLWFGLPLSDSRAQSIDQVWDQLRNQSTTAVNEGLKNYNFIIGFLDHDSEPVDNWPVYMRAGSSYRVVGVCDNDCTDVDLSLEDSERTVLVSDLLEDDLPMVSYTPKTTATYWIRPTMVVCSVNPCGYGIAGFVR